MRNSILWTRVSIFCPLCRCNQPTNRLLSTRSKYKKTAPNQKCSRTKKQTKTAAASCFSVQESPPSPPSPAAVSGHCVSSCPECDKKLLVIHVLHASEVRDLHRLAVPVVVVVRVRTRRRPGLVLKRERRRQRQQRAAARMQRVQRPQQVADRRVVQLPTQQKKTRLISTYDILYKGWTNFFYSVTCDCFDARRYDIIERDKSD